MLISHTGLRDLGTRIDKLERNHLRPMVLITAYVILLALVVAGLLR